MLLPYGCVYGLCCYTEKLASVTNHTTCNFVRRNGYMQSTTHWGFLSFARWKSPIQKFNNCCEYFNVPLENIHPYNAITIPRDEVQNLLLGVYDLRYGGLYRVTRDVRWILCPHAKSRPITRLSKQAHGTKGMSSWEDYAIVTHHNIKDWIAAYLNSGIKHFCSIFTLDNN